MRKIFLFLLKRYTKTEKDRLIVFNVLHDSVSSTYTEQTAFGNVYNANVEFIMSNRFIKKLVRKNDTESLKIIKTGLSNSFDESINFLKSEQ